MKVCIEDKCICDSHIKVEVENVFVEFSAFCAAAIVSSQLISPVYSTHMLVVVAAAFWAAYRNPLTVLLSSKHSCYGVWL